MAQNFKSKDLTISIPSAQDKDAAVQTCACTAFTRPNPDTIGNACTHVTHFCFGFSPCHWSPETGCFTGSVTATTFTHCQFHTCTVSPMPCQAFSGTPCLHSVTTVGPCTLSDPPLHQEISSVTDAETLAALKEKLASAIKEVEAQQAAAKAKK